MPYLDYVPGNMRLWNVPWNVVDFETTYKVSQPEPIEIAIVSIRGGEIDYDSIYGTLLHPSRPIPPWMGDELPITQEMLEDAPRIDEVRRQVRRQIISGVFVHHAMGEARGFDARFASEFFGVNRDRLYIFSTIKLSRLITPGARAGHSLETLCRRWRVSNREPHRARSDAVATGKVFLKMLEVLYAKQITTFARFRDFYDQVSSR